MGIVVQGDGRGRALGFPTANMSITTDAVLAQGIWASWCRLKGETTWRRGALHVGPRPTFADDRLSVELHILDFPDRDLYGEELAFTFVAPIREVEQFDSENELQMAIEADCKRARQLLVNPPEA